MQAVVQAVCFLRLTPTPMQGFSSWSTRRASRRKRFLFAELPAIRITSAVYNNNITYLPAPTPAPTGCGADCEAAVRSYIPVGTENVDIKAGGQTVGHGTVIRNEYGMVVLAGAGNNSPPLFPPAKRKS